MELSNKPNDMQNIIKNIEKQNGINLNDSAILMNPFEKRPLNIGMGLNLANSSMNSRNSGNFLTSSSVFEKKPLDIKSSLKLVSQLIALKKGSNFLNTPSNLFNNNQFFTGFNFSNPSINHGNNNNFSNQFAPVSNSYGVGDIVNEYNSNMIDRVIGYLKVALPIDATGPKEGSGQE